MYNCVPCHRHFSTWRRFKDHMLELHRVAEANLLRRAVQVVGREVYAVQYDSGGWAIYAQPELL